MRAVLVRDVMTTQVKMVAADISVGTAARLMATADVSEIVLVSVGKYRASSPQLTSGCESLRPG